MNQLSIEKKAKIVQLLLEGNSLQSSARISGSTVKTITKILEDVGKACIRFHNQTVRNMKCSRIECDEVWSYVYSKQKNTPYDRPEAGDMWTFLGIDADTKMIISWLVGPRNLDTATYFMKDLSARISTKIQLTTDGYKAYIKAVDSAFTTDDDIDFAQLVKIYSKPGEPSHEDNENKKGYYKYSGARKDKIFGTPNEKFITTSHVERQNLTMRTNIKRFTRKTNAFSKKLENHYYSQAIHFVYYNFVRIHKTLRVPPAMQAGLIKRIMKIEDIVNLVP